VYTYSYHVILVYELKHIAECMMCVSSGLGYVCDRTVTTFMCICFGVSTILG